MGLKDTVTAITLVALGTSLPDTFASKVAAVNDKYADSSVGNVTGSNAVNVFLGVGVAWFVAAVYHEIKGLNFPLYQTIFPGFIWYHNPLLTLRRSYLPQFPVIKPCMYLKCPVRNFEDYYDKHKILKASVFPIQVRVTMKLWF